MRKSILVTDGGFNAINPVLFGYESCEKGHAFGPAVRRFWLIHFVVSGYGRYQIEGRSHSLGPGDLFVIPPFAETFYRASQEHPWEYIWIGFTCRGELPLSLGDTAFCPEALSVFNEMKRCESLSGGRSAFLCARLWDLFSLLSESRSREKDFVEDALACIHSEYMNDLTVEQIAGRLNLDRSYFSVRFKERMGISPKQYLVRYRMSLAAKLMTENQKSVSVAAYSVGYPDIFSFSKMFKRCYGVSPQEYVREKRK